MDELATSVASGPTESIPEPIGVVELLNHAGHVLQRATWKGERMSVGRAYDNDLIVADPYVCPHHLELVLTDGRVFARDLGSINGTYVDRESARRDTAELHDKSLILFGHSQLRFRSAAVAVPPAWRDTARHGVLSLLAKPWLLVVATVAGVLALAADSVLESAEEVRVLTLGSELLYPLIGVIIWAGFWALLNRIMTHRANFPVHLTIALAGVAGLFTASQLILMLGFGLGWTELSSWLETLGQIIVLALVMYAHLRYAVPARADRQALVAGLAALVLFGTPQIGDVIARNEFSSLPYLNPVLMPPALKIVKGGDIDDFLASADHLRKRVDAKVDE